MGELTELTATEARRLLAAGEVSSVELTRAFLDRIARRDGEVRAYLAVDAEQAVAMAASADERRRAEPEEAARLPLLGVPVAVKDVICVSGMPTTCGSRMLENFYSPYEAAVIDKIRAAGMVILGKTNTDEFAMGSSTENSAFFTTHNPWDLTRVPGGSSGGSAAAVSAGLAPLALGSDTGGSVRQPAALCGVVGIKPSYGRVSRYGLVAYASSLDQIGTLGTRVRDAAMLLSAIAGHDPRDSTSVPLAVPDYAAELDAATKEGPSLRGVRVGLPREYLGEGLQEEVLEAVQTALGVLERLGAEVREVSLPHTRYALPTYYLIAPAECSANLARYDGIRYGLSLHQGAAGEQGDAEPAADIWDAYRETREAGFGAEVKRRIMLGTFALSAGYYDAFYLKAQKVRTLIKEDLDRAWDEVDVIVGPTSPTTAFAIGERVDDPLEMYLSDIYTLSANLAGICGISVPCGMAGGLPIGLQIQGPAFGEMDAIRVAHAYEQATPWHAQRPPVGGIS